MASMPLTGLMHDRMVRADGLPGLPGALQDGGRPASVQNGRQAVSPPLDGQTVRGVAQVRPEPTHL